MVASKYFKDVFDGHGRSSIILDSDMKRHIFFSPTGTGAFLRDPLICGELEGFCIWVSFNLTYEGGSYSKRKGHTPWAGRFNGCADNEIVIKVSNHQTSRPCPRNIQLNHLVPASPVKKGDPVVILSGDHQCHVMEVR